MSPRQEKLTLDKKRQSRFMVLNQVEVTKMIFYWKDY
jgi:hypothetical protein